mgnify:CR=1 FL=1
MKKGLNATVRGTYQRIANYLRRRAARARVRLPSVVEAPRPVGIGRRSGGVASRVAAQSAIHMFTVSTLRAAKMVRGPTRPAAPRGASAASPELSGCCSWQLSDFAFVNLRIVASHWTNVRKRACLC